jgi:hypothetical protein
MSSCFISEEGKVIVIINSISEASPHKLNGSTVSKYQLSVYERSRTNVVVARLIKLDRSFPAVQVLRNKHFQGLWPCWRREGSLDEDTVLIRDIPEPIIKEFLCNMMLRYWLACFLMTVCAAHDITF